MIHVLINTLAEKMNEFLSNYYERAEIIVEAGSIDATPNEDQSDKIILSIVNIERETAMESIQILSDSISFLQQNSILKLPDQGTITLEPVTISMQELSNIWSILGGHYYPSILCKARIISFDGTEIKDIKQRISSQKIN